MKIRAGYSLTYECSQPTDMLLVLSIHPSREKDLLTPHVLEYFAPVPVNQRDYVDGFGNVCSRITAPSGLTTIKTDFTVEDSGQPDEVNLDAVQHPVHEIPDDVLVYLLGSRYCDTDRLSDTAWQLFGNAPMGWGRVQAICDFVHNHIAFNYQNADSMRAASNGFSDKTGVCRDFAHLAVTFCRAMNIPARHCTGYLGDIGVPLSDSPMDFSAWFQAWLGGRWYTFDARHNTQRIGRILMATGRDATDVALSTSFGNSRLVEFKVRTDEVTDEAQTAGFSAAA